MERLQSIDLLEDLDDDIAVGPHIEVKLQTVHTFLPQRGVLRLLVQSRRLQDIPVL